jgi:hypothetical protein
VSVSRDGKERTVEVRIPAGIKDGARVRAAGEARNRPATRRPAISICSSSSSRIRASSVANKICTRAWRSP